MRFFVALLVLANLTLYLLAYRLPGPEALETPSINLPRVTRIKMLDPDGSEQPGRAGESGCFRIGGFLSPAGARNWLVLAGLPLDNHRIMSNGLVDRPVLAVSYSGESPFSPLGGSGRNALEPFSILDRAPTGGLDRWFLFPDSTSIAAPSIYRSENKRGFALESERVSFYSYAIEGGEQLRDAWSSRFPARGSGKLQAESCESIAKQGQNP